MTDVKTEGMVKLELTIPEYLYLLALVNTSANCQVVSPSYVARREIASWCRGPEDVKVSTEEAAVILQRAWEDKSFLWGRMVDAGFAQIQRVPAGVILRTGS